MSTTTHDLAREVFGGSSDDDSDWDEPQEEVLSKKSPVKKRKPTPTKEKSSKKRKGADSDVDGDDGDPDDEEAYDAPQRPKTTFEAEMEGLKNREKAYRKEMNDIEVTAETDEKVEGFIKRMDNAMHLDREAMKDNKPALHVLNMLDLTFKTLSKRQLQESFVGSGVLSVLANWMEPYDDGTSPHSSVRTLVMKLCDQFSIDSYQLKESGLGQVVAKVKKDKKEPKANRRMAQELIRKWCRDIFPTATTDYLNYSWQDRAADALEREQQLKERKKQTAKATERSKEGGTSALSGAIAGSSQAPRAKSTKSSKRDREEMLSKRARVPQAQLDTYARPPPSEVGVEDRLNHMRRTMSSGDRKIKSVRESRGKAAKARVVGMKIVGV